MRPHVERMITLGKRGDLASRRLAGAWLMTREALTRLFDTVAPRFGDREGGYLRIIRKGYQRGDGAEKVFVELLGSEKIQAAKREKRAEARAKRADETRKAAASRVRKWMSSKRSGLIGPKILGKTYCRMLPVCFSEKASLDAVNTSAVHSSAGSQYR